MANINLPVFSLVIPIFKSEANLPSLFAALSEFASKNVHRYRLEAVFVVDGSPDQSLFVIKSQLETGVNFDSKLCALSRNFGAFEAVRSGLEIASGKYFAIYAADLQEPLHLVNDSFDLLEKGEHDVCFGKRLSRDDPFFSKMAASIFWGVYRHLIDSNVPAGGTDIIICNTKVRDAVLSCAERHSTLIGLFFWVGFRRTYIPYHRQKRTIGKSSWTFSKKIKYLLDSMFAFSDLPLKILLLTGTAGMLLSVVLAIVILFLKMTSTIDVPGYTATVLTVLFFGGVNSMGIGLLGEYVWRTFENTKQRPHAIKMDLLSYSIKNPVSGRVLLEPMRDL